MNSQYQFSVKDSKLVYSTSGDSSCTTCGKALHKCRCEKEHQPATGQGSNDALIQLQSKGRGGKEVTVVTGLTLNGMEMLALLRELKSALGCGGALKRQQLELQGNRIDAIKRALNSRGIIAKVSGV